MEAYRKILKREEEQEAQQRVDDDSPIQAQQPMAEETRDIPKEPVHVPARRVESSEQPQCAATLDIDTERQDYSQFSVLSVSPLSLGAYQLCIDLVWAFTSLALVAGCAKTIENISTIRMRVARDSGTPIASSLKQNTF